jgi:hypothetical protein
MENGDEVAEKHVSSMVVCNHDSLKTKRMEKNQSWTVRAKYDYDRFAGNMAEGKQQDIMGIGFLFIEAPAEGIAAPKL